MFLFQVSWMLQQSVAEAVNRRFLIQQAGIQIQVSAAWSIDTIITLSRQLYFINIVKCFVVQ